MGELHSVSLFSNCGAGDLGFRQAGFSFVLMAEIDERRLAVALLNHAEAKGAPGDLRETWPGVVGKFRSVNGNAALALLSACPPCQSLSSANGDRGHESDPDVGSKDPRNLLVLPIAKIAAELTPRVLVVENVRAFLTRKVRHPETDEPISAASLLISLLDDEYEVFPLATDLADYGVPQTRRRCFLTFARRDEPWLATINRNALIPYPCPTHATDHGGAGHVLLRDAFATFALPALDASSDAKATGPADKPLHFVPVWNDEQYAMVAAIPPDSGASAWENSECGRCGLVEAEDEGLFCPGCGGPLLRPTIQEDDGSYRFVKGFRRSSYRRMSPDRPAATVTTASNRIGSDRTIHPSENRVLSPLECALLQTFPDDFEWGDALDEYGPGAVRQMIGEAVPPRFTRLHGEVLASLIGGGTPDNLLSRTDIRCVKAWEKLGCTPAGG